MCRDYINTITMRNSTFFFIILFSAAHIHAQLTPMESMIPMRDGKFLAADCHMADTSGSTQYPTILIQTPYNKVWYRISLPLGIGTDIASCPYAIVIVDWRGFYGSAAASITQPNRGEDGYDVVEWISQQPWSDGTVGTWGPSALGRVQYMTAKEKHPAHICAVPLVAAPQYSYEEYFQGGVYRKEYVDQLDNLGFGMSTLLLSNPYYNNLWIYSEATTFYPEEIEIPLFMIGGWYDHNINVMLDFFEGLQTSAPVSVRDKHKILIGPWAHGGFGMAQVGTGQQGELFFPEAAGWSDSLALQFFDYYLLGIANGWDTEPVVRWFMPGTMTWQQSPQWPSTVLPVTNLYFHDDGSLKETQQPSGNFFMSYNYDPSDPSPSIGGMTLRQDLLQGPYDQAVLVESRNDILVFSTEELSQEVAVEGTIKVVLFVSSDQPDTDFAVRLTDVYPDNRSILIREGILRSRFRDGFTINDTAFMQSGSVYEIVIELFDLAHTFMPGHKIRIDISSSNYPRFDNNLNNGGEMYIAGDTLIAHNTILCNASYPSRIELPMSGFPSGMHSNFTSDSFVVYPNPFQKSLFITQNATGTFYFTISDLSGKTVLEGQSSSSFNEITTEDFPSGVYFLTVYNTEDIQTFKILKQ